MTRRCSWLFRPIPKILLPLVLVAFMPRPSAGEPVRAAVGTVVAVAPESRTVVVEVPTEKGSLTVGGPVTWDAALCTPTCGAQVSSLEPGQRVAARWRSASAGPRFVSFVTLAGPTILVNIVLKIIPSPAQVFFDGGLLGKSARDDGMYVGYGYWPAGSHTLRVVHPDFSPWERIYTLSASPHEIRETATLTKKKR